MNLTDYIASGILEEFVLGLLSREDRKKVLKLAEEHPEIKAEIKTIELTVEKYAFANSVDPPSSLEDKVFASIQASEIPPTLSANSKIAEYDYWLEKTQEPEEYENLHMEVLSENSEATMVIAWIKDGEQNHLHTKYTEKFLIVEGSCIATIDGVTANYEIGDYVEFTIDKHHDYTVTSDSPMKVIACLTHKAA